MLPSESLLPEELAEGIPRYADVDDVTVSYLLCAHAAKTPQTIYIRGVWYLYTLGGLRVRSKA